MKNKKYWMIASRDKNHILLHYNENLPQYKKLKRISNQIIKKIK